MKIKQKKLTKDQVDKLEQLIISHSGYFELGKKAYYYLSENIFVEDNTGLYYEYKNNSLISTGKKRRLQF